jgi:hypothetical protein
LPVEKWGAFGLIYLRSITQDSISFFAFIVRVTPNKYLQKAIKAYAIDLAGNKDHDDIHPSEIIYYQDYRFRYVLTDMTVMNNFTGSIHRFFINAEFPEYPVI